MALPDLIPRSGDLETDIQYLWDYLWQFIADFPNAVGQAIDPTEGEGGDGSLVISDLPTNITYTPSSILDDNGVPTGNIIVNATLPTFSVGLRIYYRQVSETSFKQSYGTDLPYTLIALLSAKTYDLQVAGEAANGFIGPRSPITQVTIPVVSPAIEHGSLIGLDDFDHEQYFPRDGHNPITGPLPHTGSTVGLYSTTPVTQASAEVNLTNNITDTPDDTINPTGLITSLAFPFTSPSGSSGSFYFGGFYLFAASDNDFSPSTTLGTVNSSYAAHFFIVVGAVPVDTLTIRVTGTSIDQSTGTRTTSDTEDIILTTASLVDDYHETTKLWLGQVTISVVSGTAVTCNYGYAEYFSADESDFAVIALKSDWLGGANDTGADIILHHHKPTGWTFNAGAAPSPPTASLSMSTDHSTEDNVTNGVNGSWARTNINLTINADSSEGLIFEIVTTANKAFESGVIQISLLFSASIVNENFTDLTTKVNKLLDNDRDIGIMA